MMMMVLHDVPPCDGDVEEMTDNYYCCEYVQDVNMRYDFSGSMMWASKSWLSMVRLLLMPIEEERHGVLLSTTSSLISG